MVYSHLVKVNGVYYLAGEDVKEETKQEVVEDKTDTEQLSYDLISDEETTVSRRGRKPIKK